MANKIKINDNFSHNSQLYGPGIWTIGVDIAADVAKHLIERGKATEHTAKEQEEASSEDEKPKFPISDIPADFPARNLLIGAGITTIEQLKGEGIKDDIEKISGIGPDTLAKIGVAITEL